jgi:hypothetical protein
MVSVSVTSQQPIVPEAASHMVTLTGLTESSSSSKLTFDNTSILSSYLYLKREHLSQIYFEVWNLCLI